MEISPLVIVILVVSGVVSFLVGRRLSRGRREKKMLAYLATPGP